MHAVLLHACGRRLRAPEREEAQHKDPDPKGPSSQRNVVAVLPSVPVAALHILLGLQQAPQRVRRQLGGHHRQKGPVCMSRRGNAGTLVSESISLSHTAQSGEVADLHSKDISLPCRVILSVSPSGVAVRSKG